MAHKITHVIKHVEDVEDTKRFCRNILNLQFLEEKPGQTEFRAGDIVLILRLADDANPPGTIHLGFSVLDVSRFADRLDRVRTEYELRTTESEGKQLWFRDGDGTRWHVVE